MSVTTVINDSKACSLCYLPESNSYSHEHTLRSEAFGMTTRNSCRHSPGSVLMFCLASYRVNRVSFSSTSALAWEKFEAKFIQRVSSSCNEAVAVSKQLCPSRRHLRKASRRGCGTRISSIHLITLLWLWSCMAPNIIPRPVNLKLFASISMPSFWSQCRTSPCPIRSHRNARSTSIRMRRPTPSHPFCAALKVIAASCNKCAI